MSLNLCLLIVLVAAALWTVMTRSILRAAIGLALTSVVLTIIIFALNSPIAAVFELSVCAGLISVLFISTISITQPYTTDEVRQRMEVMFRRFKFLPLVVLALGIMFIFLKIKPALELSRPETIKDARIVLWDMRRVDMVGQIIILLTGVFGVITLFKERMKK